MEKHYLDHLKLLEEWRQEISLLSEKHGDKKGHKSKPKSVRVAPDDLDDNAVGLRLTDKKTGEDATVTDVDGGEVVLSNPVGRLERLSKTSVSSRKKLG